MRRRNEPCVRQEQDTYLLEMHRMRQSSYGNQRKALTAFFSEYSAFEK
jgi:hypothetical protein